MCWIPIELQQTKKWRTTTRRVENIDKNKQTKNKRFELNQVYGKNIVKKYKSRRPVEEDTRIQAKIATTKNDENIRFVYMWTEWTKIAGVYNNVRNQTTEMNNTQMMGQRKCKPPNKTINL